MSGFTNAVNVERSSTRNCERLLENGLREGGQRHCHDYGLNGESKGDTPVYFLVFGLLLASYMYIQQLFTIRSIFTIHLSCISVSL